ncbi:MAG: lipid-binding SYLF domain-containing protein [Candidatus Nitronauta litoralis]|uniref:Lipid-binding SYLF domain-containing protein n=1 Tax=Candidatus Nitronauta litoralis TaxID=2705533 RepID=A0A7T0BZC6_9BACT|nr:MAG: lipid-binding SYLF domain-containing protein [Candidatus Nitronauta litoralis]
MSALTLLFVLLFTSTASAWHTEKHELLNEAVEVLKDMQDAPDVAIPTKLLQKAKAIVVIPTLLKGGFMLGARYGEGIATVRNPYTGKWGPPSFITSAGASFGFQAGAQAIDLVLLVMSERGIKGLLKDNFTLGGDIALTAGPVGRYAEAGADILMQGEIYSYSRSKGLFGGVSLKGTVVQPNEDKNRSYYGTTMNADQILMGGKLKRIPKTAMDFIGSMNKVAPPFQNPYQGEKLAQNEAPSQPIPAQVAKPANPVRAPQAAPPVMSRRVEPSHPKPPVQAKSKKQEPLW